MRTGPPRRWSSVSRAALVLAAAGCASRPTVLPPGDPLDLVSPETLFRLGIELEAGDSIRAEQYLSAALARGYPEAEVIPAILGVCVRASRFGDALDYAEPYLSRHPEDWPLRALVASIHMGLGHPIDALRHLELVLEIAPDQPSGHYLLAVLSRDSLSDPETARAHFARYLELAPDGEHASEARLELRRLGADGGMLPAPVRLPSHASGEDEGEGGEPTVTPASATPAGVAPADTPPPSADPPPP